MSTIQQRLDAQVAERNNTFATGNRSKKVAQIIGAISASDNSETIFNEMIAHELTESQWRLVDGLSGLKHPSSEITRECVRQVVIFGVSNERPASLSTRLLIRVKALLG